MEPATVLNQLQGMGLTLSVIEGSKIKVQPKQAITEEARRLIRQHKNTLLGILNTENQTSSRTHKTIRAAGYGCSACGNKIYSATMAWETYRLPETASWEYEHRLVAAWVCRGCGETYPVINGSKGPQYIN